MKIAGYATLLNLGLLMLFVQINAEEVLYFDGTEKSLFSWQRLQLACRYYGIDIKRLILQEPENNILLADLFKHDDLSAIVISASSLSFLDIKKLHSVLKDLRVKIVPLLILGISSDIESDFLGAWSSGGISICNSYTDVHQSIFYRVSDLRGDFQKLAGLKIPIACNNINYFFCNMNQNMQSLIQVSNNIDDNFFPIFIKTIVDEQEVFFLAKNYLKRASAESSKKPFSGSTLYDESYRQYDEHIFQLLPIMMFLRYACGDQCWHAPGNYANLTIDDPWLTEPYGNLSYLKLLNEMKKANFHTTIGFIPWNYDRSKSGVVSLFRRNPDRLSICIHGNDHDHQEFYKYETKLSDLRSAKSQNVQEENIKQALARMAKFKSLTRLSYDKVMVFPHGIAPAKTLGLLKKYNFLATVNAGNIPLGSQEPQDILFRLRPVTLIYENFPSLKRYTPSRFQGDIAIDLFLDNPLLFYAHHDFFKDGIDAFNETAEMINNIEPDIIWQSLGYICKHYYLEKLRDDDNYDVKAFSGNFILVNTHQRDLTFFVRREESFSFPIKQVLINGHPCFYSKSERNIMLEVYIPAGESRHIVIEYENNLDLASVDTSKNDSHVNRLRTLSDFRDMTLSRNVFGRAIISVYYDTGLYKLGFRRLAIITFVLIILITAIIWSFIRRKKKQKIFSIHSSV